MILAYQNVAKGDGESVEDEKNNPALLEEARRDAKYFELLEGAETIHTPLDRTEGLVQVE